MERRKLPPRRGGAHPRKHYTRPPDSRQNGFPVEIIQSLEGVGCGLTRSSNEESANEDPFAKHDVVVIQCEKLSSALGKAPNSSRNWTWRLKLAEEQEKSPSGNPQITGKASHPRYDWKEVNGKLLLFCRRDTQCCGPAEQKASFYTRTSGEWPGMDILNTSEVFGAPKSRSE